MAFLLIIQLFGIKNIIFLSITIKYIIMCYRLVGCPPFWHRKQMVMLRNIMEGKYSFSSPEWTDISG